MRYGKLPGVGGPAPARGCRCGWRECTQSFSDTEFSDTEFYRALWRQLSQLASSFSNWARTSVSDSPVRPAIWKE